jgi:hypothetical protein
MAEEIINIYRNLMGKPLGKTLLGITKRWDDDIKMDHLEPE